MTVFVERSWTNVDKAGWGEGPWNDEPDKVQWVDDATGFDCLAVRHDSMGHWCGYVGLPPEHPCHGAHYDAVRVADDDFIELTFSDKCMEDKPEGEGVCHVPYHGRPDDVWWLGFDFAHHGDMSPGMRSRYKPNIARMFLDNESEMFGGTYKQLEYVRNEATKLASQLVAARVEVPEWRRNDG